MHIAFWQYSFEAANPLSNCMNLGSGYSFATLTSNTMPYFRKIQIRAKAVN